MIDTDKYGKHKREWKVKDTHPEHTSTDADLGWQYEDIVAVKGNGHYHYTVAQMVDASGEDAQLIAAAPDLLQALIDERAEVQRLRKREATFDAFIDSLDCHNEHEWMLIERIDEIDERLHGGEGE